MLYVSSILACNTQTLRIGNIINRRRRFSGKETHEFDTDWNTDIEHDGNCEKVHWYVLLMNGTADGRSINVLARIHQVNVEFDKVTSANRSTIEYCRVQTTARMRPQFPA